MGRKLLTDASLRPLILQLCELFLVAGSVNALKVQLQEALGDSDGMIYPNRLHALLSDDPSQSVNPKTIELISQALAQIEPAPVGLVKSKCDEITIRISNADQFGVDGSRKGALGVDRVKEIASSLSVPPAVIRYALDIAEKSTQHRSGAGTASDGKLLELASKKRTEIKADWSYQDDAYAAALRSLRTDPNRKVGLVIPTGGGKTRIGVRILLRVLADHPRSDSIVLWVTHRRFLATQARRELQRSMSEGTPDLPENSTRLLADRVVIVMISEIQRRLDEYSDRIALVVVDEAHHAAAPSYAQIINRKPLKGLFLTATPLRSDGKSIGVDEICYTITYRALFDRGVLIEPSFEEPYTLGAGGWANNANLEDFCDYVLERSQSEFSKTIIVASRVEHVTRIYEGILEALEPVKAEGGHVLDVEDIGYVHGSGTSSGIRPDEFLDEFIALPRGILVTTAQMLGEGFDDPSVNAVIVTYATTSMVQLMQVAGRCLRYSPRKKEAFIVQVKESNLAYHFEQRWLYQDISDALRPQIEDRTYTSRVSLVTEVGALLDNKKVDTRLRDQVMQRVAQLGDGEEYAILLTGLPFSGESDCFASRSEWGVVDVLPSSRDKFLKVFNDFCEVVGDVKSATEFLKEYLDVDTRSGSEWVSYRDMLTAMEYAHKEIHSVPYVGAEGRSYLENQGTTWLRYVVFRFKSEESSALMDFLQDCVNREQILIAVMQSQNKWVECLKIPIPLGGCLAYLLESEQTVWFKEMCRQLTVELGAVEPARRVGWLASWHSTLVACPVPFPVVAKIDLFLTEHGAEAFRYQF